MNAWASANRLILGQEKSTGGFKAFGDPGLKMLCCDVGCRGLSKGYCRKDPSGLQSIGMVESERTIDARTTVQRRYYLSSLKANARELAKAVRTHWEVENKAHWCLDVLFHEDRSRARLKFAAENLALLRRLSLNILRRDVEAKQSLRIRQQMAR